MDLNDDLKRVQIGRYKEVPIEKHRGLWFIWYYENGKWDSEAITRSDLILVCLENKSSPIKEIFCIWHGEYKTNLFLMDKKDLIKRLHKITK